jgi:hypothetical protein
MFTIGWTGEAAAASLMMVLQRVRCVKQLASDQDLPDILLLVGDAGGGLDGWRGHDGRELPLVKKQDKRTGNRRRSQEETGQHLEIALKTDG